MKNFLDKLFGRQQLDTNVPQTGEIVTAPLNTEKQSRAASESHPTQPVALQKEAHLEPPQLVVGLGQSVGKQRDVNEDTLFAFSSTLASNSSQVPFGLYVVADGMGGHQHGEVASETAIRVMVDYILRNLYIPLINPNATAPKESLQEIMKNSTLEAHKAILHNTPDGGTTLTACLIIGKQMTIAHVGDSRAYLADQNGKLDVLTRDHSLVRRLEEMGQITAEEAQTHPQKNVLYRALGQGEPIEPEIQSQRLPTSGYLLICSDGLWGVVPENHISAVLSTQATPTMLAQQLVNMANDAGGPDNISVILVRVSE